MSILERAGIFAVAAALLFAAYRIHGASGGRKPIVTKSIGLILSFVAGLAFLVTFAGGWMSSKLGDVGGFAVAGLIACAVIIIVDWLLDKKPDKPAFWAAFALALFLVVGVAQLPAVGEQIGDGGAQVGAEIKKVSEK